MIIIIEGIDGSGKTVLANKLSEQTGYPIVHMSYPKNVEESQTMLIAYKTLLLSGKNAIFDRGWYSELAYGPIKRGVSALSISDMFKLENIAAKTGAMIIYCNDSAKDCWRRCQKRGEDYITSHDDFDKIYANFEDIFNNLPHIIPVVKYGVQSML